MDFLKGKIRPIYFRYLAAVYAVIAMRSCTNALPMEA